MAEKTKILFVDDTDLRTKGAPGMTEVVTLADFEHTVDAIRDELRDERFMARAVGRLCRGYPGQPPLAAVMSLVEEVDHYRKLRDEEPVVAPPVIAIAESVPALEPMGSWSLVGWGAGRVAVLRHPGMEGFALVTADAWENHQSAVWGH